MNHSPKIKWIKSVKRDFGNKWAYLEYGKDAIFDLHWPKKFKENHKKPKVDEGILIYQKVEKSVYSTSGFYFTHLVSPIDNNSYDFDNPSYPWVRRCKVIAYAGLSNLIPRPEVFKLNNLGWGDCRVLNDIKNIKISNPSEFIWDLFFKAEIEEEQELNGYKEGAIKEQLKIHKWKERNKEFVKKIKEKNKNLNTCPACETNLTDKYKLQGIELLEMHHIVPLFIKSEEYELREQDVVLLCPSCHRAIHKKMSKMKNKVLTLKEFKTTIE